MSIIEPIPDGQAAGAAMETYQTLHDRVGLVPNMYRTLAHAPKVLQSVLGLGQAIRSDLDPKLRELAYLKTADIHDCHY